MLDNPSKAPPPPRPPPPLPELPPEPIKPHRQPAMTLFNALGAALGLGVAIGGLLVYAFSRPTVDVLE